MRASQKGSNEQPFAKRPKLKQPTLQTFLRKTPSHAGTENPTVSTSAKRSQTLNSLPGRRPPVLAFDEKPNVKLPDSLFPTKSNSFEQFSFEGRHAIRQPSTPANTSWRSSSRATGNYGSDLYNSRRRKLRLSTTKTLSEEQLKVHRQVLAGKSVFFTGAAGTGKSLLLKEIINNVNERYMPHEIGITATTGLAALNIGGQTLHRWAAVGLGKETPARLHAFVNKSRDGKRRWLSCKVLIIDEVSMLDANFLDKLEQLARIIRNNSAPFGGIQLVLTGDFFQLPPVGERGQPPPKLCFEAECWNKIIQENLLLRTVFRQQGDDKLVSMLAALRSGNLCPEIVDQFKALTRPVVYDDNLEPTRLYPLREQVNQANNERMRAIAGRNFRFTAQDSGPYDAESTKRSLANVRAPEQIDLKVGAQVLLIQNLSANLVNGSRGRVVTFVAAPEWNQLQVLNLSTGGKALDLYNRLLELDGKQDTDLEESISRLLSTDQQVLLARIYSMKPHVPVIDFGNAGQVAVEYAEFVVNGPAPKHDMIATRFQLPLIHSWALSIHKAQGQTLDRLVVDLNRIFEKGQAYVAISRATSYDRLQVIGFDERKIHVDSRVVDFYSKL